MDLTSVVVVVLVVLVLRARDAQTESRIQNLGVVRRCLSRRGVVRRNTNVFWLNLHTV